MSNLKCCFSSSHQSITPDAFSHSRSRTNIFHHNIAPFGRIISHPTTLKKHTLLTYTNPPNRQLTFISRCVNQYSSEIPFNSDDEYQKPQQFQKQTEEKSFWGAVGLIIGTAVGPGMLGLPAATIKSGPIPSTIAIILSWVYVISSILLVAELSFAIMEEDNLSEVSFTLIATKTLGTRFGSFVALVYASLSFSLLVACVSGIGSIFTQWFPFINPLIIHAFFPLLVGIVLCFFSFKVIDAANRFLIAVMFCFITSLVSIGVFVGRISILRSFLNASWGLSSILPAIPVTVLTLGFHVITPFVCKIAGNTVNEARKAILLGGSVPLVMVLSWNLIVLGLVGTSNVNFKDPISLLLTVNPSALAAVQGFAFTALATSLIGYAVSFPKQVVDTLDLIFQNSNLEMKTGSQSQLLSGFGSMESVVMPLVLGVPVILASFFPSTFSRALDFAGIYANCFLFGILPPVMAYIYQSRKKLRSSILPGGDVALLLLFIISVVLSIWH